MTLDEAHLAIKKGDLLALRHALGDDQAYAGILRSAGVDALVSPGEQPMRYHGSRWVNRSGEERVLFLGEGYIVAESFSATRLSG